MVAVLSKDAKNLELLLRDVDARGFLDIELVWKLRQKEGRRMSEGRLLERFSRTSLLTASKGLCLVFWRKLLSFCGASTPKAKPLR